MVIQSVWWLWTIGIQYFLAIATGLVMIQRAKYLCSDLRLWNKKIWWNSISLVCVCFSFKYAHAYAMVVLCFSSAQNSLHHQFWDISRFWVAAFFVVSQIWCARAKDLNMVNHKKFQANNENKEVEKKPCGFLAHTGMPCIQIAYIWFYFVGNSFGMAKFCFIFLIVHHSNSLPSDIHLC